MEDDLQLARRAALAGAAVALRYFAALTGLRHERKVDGSVVTEADRAVEATIREVLRAARPGDAVLGEEGGESAGEVAPRPGTGVLGAGGGSAGEVAPRPGTGVLGAGGGSAGEVAGDARADVAQARDRRVSEGSALPLPVGEGHADAGRADGGGRGRRRWIVDPIDGTALFVAGDDRWLVLVALEEDGVVVAGVAVVPVQGRIWWARRGHGAWEADTGDLGAARRITVGAGGPAALPKSRLAVLPALDDAVTGANVVPKAPEVVAALLAVTPARPWALHPPLLVARGDLDLAVQTSGQVWDFAATSLIVAEAGGVYSGLDGRARPGAGPSVFARDGGLRDAALRLIGR